MEFLAKVAGEELNERAEFCANSLRNFLFLQQTKCDASRYNLWILQGLIS